MDKEEKEIETPSKGGKSAVKKRPGSSAPGTPAAAPPVPRPVKVPAPPPAVVGSTNSTTAPALPPAAAPAPAPATHTGLPQQVIYYSLLLRSGTSLIPGTPPFVTTTWYANLYDTRGCSIA